MLCYSCSCIAFYVSVLSDFLFQNNNNNNIDNNIKILQNLVVVKRVKKLDCCELL